MLGTAQSWRFSKTAQCWPARLALRRHLQASAQALPSGQPGGIIGACAAGLRHRFGGPGDPVRDKARIAQSSDGASACDNCHNKLSTSASTASRPSEKDAVDALGRCYGPSDPCWSVDLSNVRDGLRRLSDANRCAAAAAVQRDGSLAARVQHAALATFKRPPFVS
jgi:hypothetical protein